MATTTEINIAGDNLAAEITAAENSLPSAWKNDPLRYMPNIRQNMNRAIMKGVFEAFDSPWYPAMATGQYHPDRAILAPGWFNKGIGWAVAASRRISPLGLVQLRGVLYTNTLEELVLTLPPNLMPAQNEFFPTTVNGLAGAINVWVDGTVQINFDPEITTFIPAAVKYLSLSGIQYEARV